MSTSTKLPQDSNSDDIFLTLPPEWYHGQEMSSAHEEKSIKPFDMPYSYVLFLYPRDGTGVCNAELIDLQKHLDELPIDVIVGSTDSPETHNRFFNDEEAFDPKVTPNIEYPVLTIKDNFLTNKAADLILNAYGYCKRIAIIVVEGTIRAVYETDNNVQRDIDVLLHLTESVIKRPK